MIASDVNNPHFAGAQHPDACLHVQFYQELVKNEFQSAEQKRAIFDPFDFIWIQIPGNQLNDVKTYARDDHKARFPRQWAAYQARNDERVAAAGTPITEWPRITQQQAVELRAMKFYTVESVAHSSDSQLQGIGMIAGQSAFTFRDDARRFLSLAAADAKESAADEKLRQANEVLAAIEAEFATNMATMQQSMAAMQAKMEGVLETAARQQQPQNARK